MDGFVDTSVVIDIYRGYTPAVTWLRVNRALALAITPTVWMEAVEGVQDNAHQRKIMRLLVQFPILYPTRIDIDWAMAQLQSLRLSHGVGMNDCLIAASAHRLQLPLFTRNLKHMAHLLGALAQKPY